MRPSPRPFTQPDLTDGRGYAHPALAAIKAMARGEARPEQQKAALDFIIERLAATYDLSFRPDEFGGDRDTCFAEGRRFVGMTMQRIITLPIDLLSPPTKVDA